MMRCAECDCKHGDACCNWIKSDRPCPECAKMPMSDRKTLEQAAMAMRDALTAMAEAFEATADAATHLIEIAEVAEREAEVARLTAICDARKADGGIPVNLGTLQLPDAIGSKDE